MPNAATSRFAACRRRRAASMVLDQLEDRRLMSLPGDPDPIYQDDYEPNDSFADATDLGTNVQGGVGLCTITGTSTRLDVDYFRFTASQTTTVQARLDFQHSDGNLSLKLYDGNRNLLATSDTSSTLKNYESLTFNVQAGQTYYFRAGGATIHDYSINYQPLTANFDWSMPRTFGAVDQFGLPLIPNTHDYAMPNPVTINGIETPRFPVQFTVPGGITGGDVTYNWSIAGSNYSTSGSNAGLTRNFDLPEGTYNVQLTATSNGASVSTSQQITVRNYLIVSIGDSYGSGEGNPHQNAQYDWAGFATSGAKWADSPDATEALFNRMAHRSSKAGAAQAALALENSDPKTSVTFVFLNASGSTINEGALGPADSAEPSAAPGQTPAQLTHLRDIIGGRKIDTMIMSLGGNDMGFATVLRDFVTNDPAIPFHDYEGTISDILNTALDKVETLGNTGFPALAQALSQFNIGQTILTEYPDISRDSSGNFASSSIDDIVSGLEVDQHEISRAMTELMPKLVETMVKACRKFGWTYGDGLAAAYHTHGYGDWLRKASDSVWMEGPLGNRNVITALDMQNTWGTMHPTGGGLDALRDLLQGKWNAPNLAIDAFSVSGNALIDSTGTYSITIRNQSMRGAAGATQAALYMSADGSVDRNDQNLLVFNVPALAPGQSITLTGQVPQRSDPFRTNANAVFIAPVLDWNNALAESNEGDNQVYNPALVKAVVSDRDINRAANGYLTVNATDVAIGQTVNANIGIDELIGGADFDFYSINVTSGQTLDFDIDGGLDTYLAIYDTEYNLLIGTPVASNDNGFAPGETVNSGESYLRTTFQFGGRYIIAVGHAANKAADPGQIEGRVAGSQGAYSLSVTNVVANPPTAQGSYDVDANAVRFKFSTDVHTGLSADSVDIVGPNGQKLASNQIAYSYDTTTNTATFKLLVNPMADGYWSATLKASSVHDGNGTGMTANATQSFWSYAGDANRDKKVDFNDLLILAKNYGQAGKAYTGGNFDRSADGKVDFGDLLILAKQYGKSLPAAAADASPTTAADEVIATRKRSSFSDVAI